MNAINVIYPYKFKDTWVFDDLAKKLFREPFVFGIPEIIDELLCNKFDEPTDEFDLYFSQHNFPGNDGYLTKLYEENGGCYYSYEDMDGWLCPALFKYFDEVPNKIFFQLKN